MKLCLKYHNDITSHTEYKENGKCYLQDDIWTADRRTENNLFKMRRQP